MTGWRPDQVVVGLDLGTTATKALVVGLDGRVHGAASVRTPLVRPQPGWVEQDPVRVLPAVFEALREAVQRSGAAPDQIAGVGLSAALHAVLALDADDKPLTRALTWADTRAVAQAAGLAAADPTLPGRTGTPTHPMAPIAKIRWWREVHPELFGRAARFASIKEFVCHRLFGRWVVDRSVASATGLLDLATGAWDAQALALAGLRPDQLSPVASARTVLSGLAEPLARRLGLRPNTPFVLGAGDGPLATLGVGAIAPGQLAVTTGTSAAVRLPVRAPRPDPSGRTFCYALTDDRWVVGGATNAGGLALAWLHDLLEGPAVPPEGGLASGLPADLEPLLAEAAQAPPGAAGLLFLPYLAGERAPLWDPQARGAFVGLGLHHGRAHLARAVLEGVAFTLQAIARELEAQQGPPREVRAAGGLANSPLWRQVLADALGRDVLVPSTTEASALGAAALAAWTLGGLRDLDEVGGWVAGGQVVRPDPAAAAVAERARGLHTRAAEVLLPTFHALGTLQ